MRAVVRGCLAGAFVIGACGMVSAQETKSAALAKQLASALTAAKLDSVAAKDPVRPNGFVAALHIAGVQLAGRSAMNAISVVSPALLPLMASVLAPWSLSRIRHT